MRAAPASIDAMLGTTQLTLARCLKLVLRDGTELGFTDHDRDLVIALDSDFYEPLVYRAGHGMIVGDLDLALGLDADNTEASFPINELLSRAKVLGRRFQNADAYLFDADWTQSAPEPLELMAGYVAEARPDQSMAIFQIRSNADRWNSVIGSVLSPRCRADFGDIKCGKTPTTYAATVSETLSNMRFIVDLPDTYANDFFRFGTVEFTSGNLAGTQPIEVVAFDGATNEIEVLAPMPEAAAVADELLIRNGCSNVKESSDPLVPTCVTHDNVLRFRGFDQIPGTDRYLRFPIPGEGGT